MKTTTNRKPALLAVVLHRLVRALASPADWVARLPDGWKALIVFYFGTTWFCNVTVAWFGAGWVPRFVNYLIGNAP